MVRREIAQQCALRGPEVSPLEKGANAGLRLVASDQGAALTAPSAGDVQQPDETGVSATPVRDNTEFSGKLSAVRLGECSIDPETATAASKHACGYSAKYELEAGFRR